MDRLLWLEKKLNLLSVYQQVLFSSTLGNKADFKVDWNWPQFSFEFDQQNEWMPSCSGNRFYIECTLVMKHLFEAWLVESDYNGYIVFFVFYKHLKVHVRAD